MTHLLTLICLFPMLAFAAGRDTCGSWKAEWMKCKANTDCTVVADECEWVRWTVNKSAVKEVDSYRACLRKDNPCKAQYEDQKNPAPFKCHEGSCRRYADILGEAVARGKMDLFNTTLKEAGGNIEFPLSHIQETPLTLAALNARADFVRELISRGANVNHQTRNGYSALMFAAMARTEDKTALRATVEALLKAGARKDLRNGDKDSALDLAKKVGNESLYPLLK